MNYDTFEIIGRDDPTLFSRPAIPEGAYKPIKRCPSCQSIYLTDSQCEACGRSLLYHPIGAPFSAKSLYGFKERYYASLPSLVKHFSLFENKSNDQSRTYVRHLTKRFNDLLSAFGTPDAIAMDERRFFYVEMLELIDELLRYGLKPIVLQHKLEASIIETGPLLTQELLLYLNESQQENKLSLPWLQQILKHRFMGLRVEYILKVILVTATLVAVAVVYFSVISSQVGK